MSVRSLPVRPDLEQLRHQAKDLLRALHAGDAAAVASLREHHPKPIDPHLAQLSDAQLVLARLYQASSWPRLVQAAQLAEAIWRDDLETVRALVSANPVLLREPVLVRKDSNWGPPMTYAANLGRDQIITMLHGMGARDIESAAGRAALQSQIGTARILYELAGRPPVPDGALGGPAYTLSDAGTAFTLMMGAPVVDAHGACIAPVDVVIQTDGRNPTAKHAILEMYVQHGLVLPDTPTMALHRGRIDLLEAHLARDPQLLARRFTHREIYPAEVGCGDPIDATTGTPLDGTTLLHMCVEFDELDIARWLIDHGADVNARATVGPSGFGGFTPLFNTVVSQPNFWMNYGRRGPFVAPFTEMLLRRGADPNLRASIWKRQNHGHDRTMTRHDYRDVTALSYGKRFHDPIFVSEPAMALIASAGGVD